MSPQALSSERLPEDVAMRPSDAQPHMTLHASADPLPRAVPIGKLPIEVFLAIMLLVRDYWYDKVWLYRETAYRWLHATSVCRRWRSVVLGTPSLWTRITFGERMELPLLFVQRSGEAPVDLRFHGLPYNIPREIHKQVVAVVVALQHRIRSLDLSGLRESASDALVAGLTADMPLLEELQINTSEYSFWATRFLVNSVPRLSRISMTGIAFLWFCLPLFNLTKLELTRIRDLLPFNALYGILKKSPMLERLVLDRSLVYRPNREDSSYKARSHIRLDGLKTLVLVDHHDILFALLERLILPAAVSFDLSVVHDTREQYGDHHLAVLSDLLPSIHGSLQSLKGAERLSFSCSAQCLHVRVHDAESLILDVKLARALYDPTFLEGCAVSDLARIFACSPIRAMVLDSHCDVASLEDWCGVLPAFPLLECLGADGGGDYSTLYDALKQHEASGALVCPKLRDVQIQSFHTDANTVRSLTEMLRARLAAGVPLDVLSLAEKHAHHRLLEADLQTLKTLVGDFGFYCDGGL